MANDRYNAAEADARWQKICGKRGIFATPNADLRKDYYVLARLRLRPTRHVLAAS